MLVKRLSSTLFVTEVNQRKIKQEHMKKGVVRGRSSSGLLLCTQNNILDSKKSLSKKRKVEDPNILVEAKNINDDLQLTEDIDAIRRELEQQDLHKRYMAAEKRIGFSKTHVAVLIFLKRYAAWCSTRNSYKSSPIQIARIIENARTRVQLVYYFCVVWGCIDKSVREYLLDDLDYTKYLVHDPKLNHSTKNAIYDVGVRFSNAQVEQIKVFADRSSDKNVGEIATKVVAKFKIVKYSGKSKKAVRERCASHNNNAQQAIKIAQDSKNRIVADTHNPAAIIDRILGPIAMKLSVERPNSNMFAVISQATTKSQLSSQEDAMLIAMRRLALFEEGGANFENITKQSRLLYVF